MKFPRIYLVLDNCFAIKRWVKPAEWMSLIKEIGFNYAQASTDNEIDPLFNPANYMDDWFAEVQRCADATGVKVVNFYTGYQTYRTVGLAHHDARVRQRLMQDWLKPMIRRLAAMGAVGIGFSLFAIPDEALQDPDKYQERTELILDQLKELSEFAYENGGIQVSFEQMYAPHQPPWTIDGAKYYLQSVYKATQKPIYVTLDVGHMVGQHLFRKPTVQQIRDSLLDANLQDDHPPLWLGSDRAYEKWRAAKKNSNKAEVEKSAQEIYGELERYPYLFAEERDSSIYTWVEELACYSPIIHMQQTDGFHSSHAAFTPETNATGVVKGEELLRAIAKAYQKEPDPALPPRVNDIYLSFEIFAANVEKKVDIIKKLKQTLEYWRQFIPEDGLPLNELIEI